jgi:hypothetical protein
MQMRDGSEVEDARLGRLIQFDERSRAFGIRSTVEDKKPRSYTWRCDTQLDQGPDGACVGFTMAHELAARPKVVPATYSKGMSIYNAAKKIDPWPGENYEGTSTLAGIKILQSEGYIAEYRWAFGLMDLVLGVGFKGPAAVGTWWYDGMFDPGGCGFVHVSGEQAGGHCYLVNGVSVADRTFTIHNSWGSDWGDNAEAKISWNDMERLLHEDGEAVIPMVRAWGG